MSDEKKTSNLPNSERSDVEDKIHPPASDNTPSKWRNSPAIGIIAVLVVVAVAGIFVVINLKKSEGPSAFARDSDLISKSAPNFVLKGCDGKQFDLAQFRGKQNVVVFFYVGSG